MRTRPLALALLALCACSSDPASSSLADRTARLLPGSLTLKAAITPARLALGDTARIEVSLRNDADTAVTLHFPTGCQLHYVVERADGRAVPEEGGGYACTQALTTLHLEPGATARHEFPWTHTQYVSEPYARAYQPAGAYRVHPTIFWHDADGAMRRGEPAGFEVIDTATYGASPGVAIAVAPARTSVRAGDTLSVLATFRNLTRGPVAMRFTSTCHFRVAFLANGQRIGDVPASTVGDACGDALTSVTLAPGETRVERVAWRAADAQGRPLPAGGYMLVGTLGTHAPERLLEAPIKFVRVEP